MLDLYKCLENISSIDEKKLEVVIGDNDHVRIPAYLNSKRDRDTLKVILTKLTSSTFIENLANF